MGDTSCLGTLSKTLECQQRPTFKENTLEPPAGLEPAILALGGRCLIHWATEAVDGRYHLAKDCLCEFYQESKAT